VPHASRIAATEISCVAVGPTYKKKGICSATYTVFGSRSSILIIYVFFSSYNIYYMQKLTVVQGLSKTVS